ncbi:mitogen-activated protein kinase kinase kinase 20-like [Amphiura filiformis]|uniref:mitogen-activated protein kinase kinase kinase 20-like n=1 Tax=Amphiura filiformis TaxID=82378 RepID=UPI003B21F5FF
MGANLTYHERLGSGASGEVFRVTWKSKEFGTIEAAAKKIRLDEEPTAQQKSEIEFLKRLDHKNIVKYYDTVLEKKHVVIVTEYAAKGSLYDYLKDKDKLPEHLLHRWIFHLARGVNYLKENDVAHRDLKSPNCILTADNVLKICDFGIAKDLTSTKTTESAKGSIRWIAPELLTDFATVPER